MNSRLIMPATLPIARARIYRRDIDGVRAIAVLGVVLYHAGLPQLRGGFTGVDIFFVISGYLIGGHLYSEMSSGTFTFLNFYQRRVKRILPAFLVVITTTLLAAITLLSPFEAYIFTKSAIASILSISNVYFGANANYFQPANELRPLLMTWSLGIEEQFYLAIPALMLLLTRLRRALVLPAILAICILSFVFAQSYVKRAPSMAFYSLPARAWELGIGVALAVTELTWTRWLLWSRWSQTAGLVGLALILAPMYLLTPSTPFPGVYALPSVLGTALIISSATGWINQSILSMPPLIFIGRISYSWYLWHWPFLAFLRIASAGRLSSQAAAFAVAASFLAAVASYYFVEQPCRRSNLAARPVFLRYGVVSLVLLASCMTLRMGHGFPSRYPELTHDAAAVSGPCVADYGVDKPVLTPHCYSIADLRPALVLWGDSHSAVLAETLGKIANSDGYGFIQLSKSSCLPLVGAALYLSQRPFVARECVRFNNAVRDLILSDQRIRIVVMTGRWAAPFLDSNSDPLVPASSLEATAPSAAMIRDTFVHSLSESIRTLNNAGKSVIVLDDVPTFNFDPLLRYRSAHIPLRHAIAIWMQGGGDDDGLAPPAFVSAAKTTSELLNQTIGGLPKVQIIALRSFLCNERDLCAYMKGDQLLYADEHHLTLEGTKFALRSFHLPDP